jgi:hypothetical protein
MRLLGGAALVPFVCSELIITLPPGTQKCFGEELAKSELLVVKGEVILPKSKSFGMNIFSGISEVTLASDNKFDKTKNKPLFQDDSKPQIHTALTSLSAGPHWVCIENPDYRDPIEVSLSVKYGAHAKDYSQIAKRDHLEDAERKLVEIHDILRGYHSNMVFMREREEKVKVAHEAASSNVIFYSVSNLLIVVAAGALQLFYFKRFFKSKKII